MRKRENKVKSEEQPRTSEELKMRTPQEQYERGTILGELGKLVTGNMTVGEAYEQWEKTDPEKYHQLSALLARLALGSTL